MAIDDFILCGRVHHQGTEQFALRRHGMHVEAGVLSIEKDCLHATSEFKQLLSTN